MITLSGIYKNYSGKSVLADFSHTFAAGKATCIMGASGVGKTTLLRIAAGLEKPDRGEVACPPGLRASYIFQEDRLLPWWDCLTNLTALGISKEKAEQALESVGLGSELFAKPGTLSGGMRRRLAIARAIAFSGDVFFLDEPLRGLDAETARPVLHALKKAISGKTALLVTHDEREAEALCDVRLLLGEDGGNAGAPLKTPHRG